MLRLEGHVRLVIFARPCSAHLLGRDSCLRGGALPCRPAAGGGRATGARVRLVVHCGEAGACHRQVRLCQAVTAPETGGWIALVSLRRGSQTAGGAGAAASKQGQGNTTNGAAALLVAREALLESG